MASTMRNLQASPDLIDGKQPEALNDSHDEFDTSPPINVTDSTLLRQAAALSHEQHRKLCQISKDLDVAESRNLAALDVHVAEMTRMADENKALRIQLSSMEMEIAGLQQSESSSEAALRVLEQRLKQAEIGLIQRDQRLNELEPNALKLPGENTRLLRENQEMLCELERLKDIVASIEPNRQMVEQLRDVQSDLATHKSILRSSQMAMEDAKAAEKNSLLLQTQNLEQSMTLNYQREEIKRLLRVIDSLNREKALLPPTILTTALPITGQPAVMDGITKDDFNYLMDKLQGIEDVGRSADSNRGLLALQQMKIVNEQSQTISDLMSVMEDLASRQLEVVAGDMSKLKDSKYYYTSSVLHSKVDKMQKDPRIPPGFHKRTLGVTSGELHIFEADEPNIPLYVLETWKSSISIDYDKFQFVIKYKPIPTQPEIFHLLKFGNQDEFNRMFYALKYAGFLPSDIIKPVIKKVQTRVAPAPPVPKKKVPMVLMVSPTGKGPQGIRIPFVVDEVPAIFDVPTNKVNLPYEVEGLDPLSFSAKDTTCIIDREQQEFYLYHFDPINPETPPTKLLLKPKTEEDFDLLLTSGVKMDWKNLIIGADRDPSSPKRTLKKVARRASQEAIPPPPPSSAPGMADLFIVENRQLKLFENPGDEKPVLTLHSADCVTTANDAEKEFLMLVKEGTDEEETYVFNFDNENVFEEKKRLLLENGFFERVTRLRKEADKRVNQVCVVQKQRMDLYRHYGSPGDTPLLTMHSSNTTTASFEERREIQLTQTLPSGKVEKATLDCSSQREYERWNMALLFGGFLKASTEKEQNKVRSLSHLTKYIFPINLFGPTEDEPRCVRVVGDEIHVVPHPESDDPIFVFPKNETEVYAELSHRRFRMLRNRHTEKEDRCDVIMHLASEFDRLEKILTDAGFIKDARSPPPRRASRVDARFVLAKKLNLAIYVDKKATRASLSLRGLDYLGETATAAFDTKVGEDEENTLAAALAEVDEGAIVALPEERVRMPIYRFDVSSDADLMRWRFAFFIARMLPDMKDTPRFFLPTFIFGFFSADFHLEEGPSRKSGSFVGSFFGVGRNSGGGSLMSRGSFLGPKRNGSSALGESSSVRSAPMIKRYQSVASDDTMTSRSRGVAYKPIEFPIADKKPIKSRADEKTQMSKGLSKKSPKSIPKPTIIEEPSVNASFSFASYEKPFDQTIKSDEAQQKRHHDTKCRIFVKKFFKRKD